LQRGYAHQKSGGSPDLVFHNGSVLQTNTVQAIFWGDWSSSDAQAKIAGMDTFFAGLNGSNFAATSDEYSGITTGTTVLNDAFDTSTAPKKAITTSAAVAEACAMTNNAPLANAVYFLFTSTGAGHVNYCAWHSWGTCSNGAPIQVAYMPNIDGIAGCDPQDTWTTNPQGLAALANVTSHEWSEARTDPRGDGWYDAGGQENGDKCAWSFEGPVKLKNNSEWKLQGEWSNHAYDTSTGFANTSGQLGCLQGQ
jgi:hypothetical protein